jgi:lipoate-protein ligase A
MTHNELGIPAHYRAVNDIEVRGRKISGSGATEIGTSIILTGNIIFDFNFDEMVRILKVPSEKFRDKVAKTLQERLNTIKRVLSDPPSHDFVKELLRRNYENTLGVELLEGGLSQEEANTTESLERMYPSDDWTHLVENEHQDIINKRILRVSGRVSLGQTCYKTSGGLLRVLVEVKDDVINDRMITGDSLFYREMA